MKLISHRGNIIGPNPSRENTPSYIDTAISIGYDVEVDVNYINNKFYLGHDTPDYEITENWMEKRKNNLWVHNLNLKLNNRCIIPLLKDIDILNYKSTIVYAICTDYITLAKHSLM